MRLRVVQFVRQLAYDVDMRALLLLAVVPLMWTLFWVVLRLVVSSRIPSKGRTGTVVEGRWRDPDEPVPIKTVAGRPPCGRGALHGFLRFFRSEDGCKHCAEVVESRASEENEAAVREAERQISRSRDKG